jgi:hypothetical protein
MCLTRIAAINDATRSFLMSPCHGKQIFVLFFLLVPTYGYAAPAAATCGCHGGYGEGYGY